MSLKEQFDQIHDLKDPAFGVKQQAVLKALLAAIDAELKAAKESTSKWFEGEWFSRTTRSNPDDDHIKAFRCLRLFVRH